MERHHPSPATRKSAPGQLWSHLETLHLIEAYEERWYALKRGQLKAGQWEEVAAAVAARCGLRGAPGEPPAKTGTQCRHKIEKLRKRYRAERLRAVPSVWPYFDHMNQMERGPLPISVRPPLPSHPGRPSAAGLRSADDDDDDEDDDDEDERIGNNTRSINGILQEANYGRTRTSGNPSSRKRRDFEAEEEEKESEEEEEVDEGGLSQAMSQLAAVVRQFSGGLVRVEKRRMELMREVERDWIEMETKRAEMVMESQRCLVEMIAGAFASTKKAKKSQGL